MTRSAQETIDGVTESARNQRSLLVERLNSPKSVHALAQVHPSICALPEHDRRAAAQRLLKIAYTSATKNSELLKCEPSSIVAGVVEAAQLGLSVDGVLGHAYLVPYWSGKRRCLLAQMQIGYRGYLALAWRSDRLERAAAEVICKHDTFDYEEGSAPFLRHRIPLDDTDRGPVIGSYALALIRGAQAPLIRVLNLQQIYHHRDLSKAWQSFSDGKIKSTPWHEHFAAMARKTAIRDLSSLLPSEWAQRAAAQEDARDSGAQDPPAEIEDVIEMPEEDHD